MRPSNRLGLRHTCHAEKKSSLIVRDAAHSWKAGSYGQNGHRKWSRRGKIGQKAPLTVTLKKAPLTVTLNRGEKVNYKGSA